MKTMKVMIRTLAINLRKSLKDFNLCSSNLKGISKMFKTHLIILRIIAYESVLYQFTQEFADPELTIIYLKMY